MMTIGDSYHSYQKLVTEPLESVPEHTCEVLDIKMGMDKIFLIPQAEADLSLHKFGPRLLKRRIIKLFRLILFGLLWKDLN